MPKFSFLKHILIILVVVLLNATPAFAHAPGMPPFLKINGQYADQYIVTTTSVMGLTLPQDSAPEGYLVNAPINFEIDVSKLPFPPDVARTTEYFWDFGDGTTAQGLKNTHQYTKSGPYFSTINARYSKDYEPQLIQSTLINVLPSQDYKLPQPVIKVNGDQILEPFTQIKRLNFNQKINLDGASSTAGTTPIVKYNWDIGNKEFANGQVLDYDFSSNLARVFVILRVTDQNGFYSDTFVQLENTYFAANFQPSPNGLNYARNLFNSLPTWLIVVGGLLIVGPILTRVYLKRKHNE